jgi:protein O-GlcNAc transferase
VTLRGRTLPGRVGAAILEAIGLDDLVGNTVADYIEIAVTLAGDPERLVGLRTEVRRRLETSGISDIEAVTRNIEAGFRTMWRRWCAKKFDGPGL